MKRFRIKKKPEPDIEEQVEELEELVGELEGEKRIDVTKLEGDELALLSERTELWKNLHDLVALIEELHDWGAFSTKSDDTKVVDFPDFGFRIKHLSENYSWLTVRIPENHHTHRLLEMSVQDGVIVAFEDHFNFLEDVQMLTSICDLLSTQIYHARIRKEEKDKTKEEAKTAKLKRVKKLLDQQSVK